MAGCLSRMMSQSLLLVVVFMVFLWPTQGRNHTYYNVGEKDGWTIKPSETYNQWALRYQFLINDTLVFKYKKGHDSVLVVNENDYYKCNKDSPIQTLRVEDDGSKFKLNQLGPFFFISGRDQNCETGQKLIVIVRPHHSPSPSPETLHGPISSLSPSPITISMPPVKPPSSPSPSETHAPLIERISHSPSPSPAAQPPLHDIEPHSDLSPSPTPAAPKHLAHAPLHDVGDNSPSPSPAAQPPLHDIDLSPSPSPAAAEPPAHTPLVDPPSHSPSPSPAAQPPLHDIEPHTDLSPSPTPAAAVPRAHAPLAAEHPVHAPLVEPPSHSLSPSPAAQPPSHDIEQHSDRSPSPSPAAAEPPAHAPLVEPPSHSPSPSPADEPDSDSSPSPSPAAATTPAHAPSQSQSPSPSSRKEVRVLSGHITLPPHAHSSVFSPNNAPAPAPSSASDFGGSFVLILGLSLVATMISTGLV
ncbi:hypothetical protein ACS0TY_031842 [Phlomoides rotata]